MNFIEEIREAIQAGYPKRSVELIESALQAQIDPHEIVEGAMMPAMYNVGTLYQRDESELAKVLLTARCAQKGMELLQPYLRGRDERLIGKVILGTVEGDLHDMGKTLVSIMLKSAGFEVIDLGVDVSYRQFIRAASEHPDAEILCLSCLLTTSMPAMRRTVRSLRENKAFSYLYIMVGGCPITEAFARQIGADAYTDNAVDAAKHAKSVYMERRKAK